MLSSMPLLLVGKENIREKTIMFDINWAGVWKLVLGPSVFAKNEI